MALQFNPYPLEPWMQRQQREQRPDFNQTVSQPILQGLGLLQKNQEMNLASKRQAMLDDYLKQENERKAQQHAYDYGTPIDPQAMAPTGQMGMSSFMPGARTLPPGVEGPRMPGSSPVASPLIEQFNQWRASNFPKEGARPEFMGALGKEERKSIFERDNPKPTNTDFNRDLALLRLEMQLDDRKEKKIKAEEEIQVPGYEIPGGVRPRPEEATKARTALTQFNSLESGINRMKELVKENGSFQFFGKAGAEMQSLQTNLKTTLKELYALGALTGPDMALLESQISDPSSLNSLFTRSSTRQKELDTTLERLRKSFSEGMSSKGYVPQGGGNKDPLGLGL